MVRVRVRVRVRFSVKFRNLHYYISDKWTLGQLAMNRRRDHNEELVTRQPTPVHIIAATAATASD